MAKIVPLPAGRLHATFDPARIPWRDSTEIHASQRHGKNGVNPFQPRAMAALELALAVPQRGYHIYLSGESGLGRSHMLLSWLLPRAGQMRTPPDLIYVRNFANPDNPRLLALPAGHGAKFRASLAELIGNIGKNLEKRLDTAGFARKRERLVEEFQKERQSLVGKMALEAASKGFNLEMDENGGLSLIPMTVNNKTDFAEDRETDHLPRLALKRKGENLAKSFIAMMRKLDKAEENLREDERDLEQKAMASILDTIFSPFASKTLKTCPLPGLKDFFGEMRADILKNTEYFLPRQADAKNEEPNPCAEDFQRRYAANLFVDNGSLQGAPVVVEDNPNLFNLMGCMERESEMGALVTDFTLIRAGALHRANGGFLVLHIEDLLDHPQAWDALLRALRANQARIEDGQSHDATFRTSGPRPDALELNVKVIIIGDEDLYETLLNNDERFGKLFRIKAHMTDVAEKNAANIRSYLIQMATIINEAGLLPFDATALAWLVDLGSHISGDQKRLSLKFPQLKEMMIEANALATMEQLKMVDASILERAYGQKTYRSNLLEESFMEDYDREMIKVRTSGKAIGQVNGLSVTWEGDYEFGLPHSISCTVGVGNDGIIDLEREAELGGPIHTKAMMIIKSFLTGLFARKKPLVLSASLYFEQSYAGIEGDSASGAELAALLSALAEIPVRLDLAFTGAVSHSGQIMAVGGVTRKIEGFYKVCARHGLTGTQGVIIPADNVDHLMLSTDILASVEKGEFTIYPVANMEEALFLLTGMPVGKRRKDGSFTPGTLYDLVDKRLEKLGGYAQHSFRHGKKD